MNVAIVGAGAWGTAFALHLARLGHPVTLIPRRAEQAAALADSRENADYLPGVSIPPAVRITEDMGTAGAAEVAFIACPAQAMRETAARLQRAWGGTASPALIVSLAKGLEIGTHARPSEVLASIFPRSAIGALTGPTNAAEFARGLPAAMVLAAPAAGRRLGAVQAAVSSSTLRVYTGGDLPGVEFGGALKNIYAIASGCADGLNLGDNARAALLTRALAEMVRVGAALGAQRETFYGLSGFGDLIATCYGGWSRNREFGRRIGEGAGVEELLAHRRTVVEGYRTTEAFADLCEGKGIDAPILRQMRAILYSGRRPAEALAALMGRELKGEVVH
jgi:glycerol-3-phosphate dehydrogenase (NAD(P)+)